MDIAAIKDNEDVATGIKDNEDVATGAAPIGGEGGGAPLGRGTPWTGRRWRHSLSRVGVEVLAGRFESFWSGQGGGASVNQSSRCAPSPGVTDREESNRERLASPLHRKMRSGPPRNWIQFVLDFKIQKGASPHVISGQLAFKILKGLIGVALGHMCKPMWFI